MENPRRLMKMECTLRKQAVVQASTFAAAAGSASVEIKHITRVCSKFKPFTSGLPHAHRFASRADYIACTNACFTQKRTENNSARDPNNRDNHRSHHDSRFLTEEDLKEMESYVDSRHTRHPARPKASTNNDAMEPGMALPTLVLDKCCNLFIAANEKWENGSTQFFNDTWIMSLLCCHDRWNGPEQVHS